MDLNKRMPRIDPSRFSMVPRQDIPRSTFVTTHSHKTTFQSSYLVPIHVDEVLPGDVHQGQVTIFARLATPLFPIMDHLELETFFFFVPNRLLWDNWRKMMGERDNPGDSISYTVPITSSPAGGFALTSVYDYMGLPTVGTGAGALLGTDVIQCNVLPLRAYNLIWNEWFRDQNLQGQVYFTRGDGPDTSTNYALLRRNKKPDYFTSALPWPLKGGAEVPLPLGGTANVKGIGISSTQSVTATGVPPGTTIETGGTNATGWAGYYSTAGATFFMRAAGTSAGSAPQIVADLSTATGMTINAIRLAFQTQRLLERDARSGTRYTELLRSHFGVTPEDQRLQRPEYIGGGRTTVQTQAIPQTSATSGSNVLGQLGAAATATDQHSFSYSATEHGYIIGLANVRADLTYQQGRHRMWTRQTRYDFYWPVFAFLGEQAIRQDEIYAVGDTGTFGGTNATVFGYQERWAEYRHRPSRITGLFRSTAAGTIDPWHLAQKFTTAPALNATFIQENVPLSRALAAGSAVDNMQILFDSVFTIRTTRPMPMFSVPGNMDRF